MTSDGSAVRYRVIGMDCADDAAEIEKTARAVQGVELVKVSTATQVMTLRVDDPVRRLPAVEQAVTRLGYRLDPLPERSPDSADGDLPAPPTHTTPAYRRALWIVVILNLGYGIVEMVGGFLAGSQAVMADALDFFGDGAITLLGLIAIGWTLAWRARAALLQGLFLAALGVGVLTMTAYRLVVQPQQPEAELMGLLGLIALVVNVASAAVLLPHRTGDANVRAVWLFSRNDAIGNAAVVVAALLVAWTSSPLPDLVVAVMIAGLFLHAAWSIIRDAVSDLREARG